METSQGGLPFLSKAAWTSLSPTRNTDSVKGRWWWGWRRIWHWCKQVCQRRWQQDRCPLCFSHFCFWCRYSAVPSRNYNEISRPSGGGGNEAIAAVARRATVRRPNFFQGLSKPCWFGVNSSGWMRSSHCLTLFLLTYELGPMNGKLLFHSTTRIFHTKNEQNLHFAESLHNFAKLRNQLGPHLFLRQFKVKHPIIKEILVAMVDNLKYTHSQKKMKFVIIKKIKK